MKRLYGSMVTLNLRFGSISFTKNGEAEFKTYTAENNPQEDDK